VIERESARLVVDAVRAIDDQGPDAELAEQARADGAGRPEAGDRDVEVGDGAAPAAIPA
jgi:hypothetical protein